MTKLEGVELIYNVASDLGFDSLEMADIEIIMAVLKRTEKK